jgi:hypothetical protein
VLAKNSGTGASIGISGDFRVANGRLTGQVSERRCGAFPVDLPVSPSGSFSGEMKFIEDAQCGSLSARVSGTVGTDSLRIEITGPRIAVTGTLPLAR